MKSGVRGTRHHFHTITSDNHCWETSLRWHQEAMGKWDPHQAQMSVIYGPCNHTGALVRRSPTDSPVTNQREAGFPKS